MSKLDLTPRLEDADAFYKRLVDAIDAVDERAGVGVLMRLVLILANQVADETILESAIAEAARDAHRDDEEGARSP